MLCLSHKCSFPSVRPCGSSHADSRSSLSSHISAEPRIWQGTTAHQVSVKGKVTLASAIVSVACTCTVSGALLQGAAARTSALGVEHRHLEGAL